MTTIFALALEGGRLAKTKESPAPNTPALFELVARTQRAVAVPNLPKCTTKLGSFALEVVERLHLPTYMDGK